MWPQCLKWHFIWSHITTKYAIKENLQSCRSKLDFKDILFSCHWVELVTEIFKFRDFIQNVNLYNSVKSLALLGWYNDRR